jgi:hypothetical protein
VHDARVGFGAVAFGQDGGHIFIRGAGMDDKRQAGFLCGGDVDAERGFLNLGGVGGVMVIKARLADTHEFGMLGEGDQLIDSDEGFFGRAHRVGACGVEDAVIAFGDRADAGFVFQARADRDHAAHACRAGAGNHLGQFLFEIGEIEVAVAVDEFGQRIVWRGGHQCSPMGERSRRLFQFQHHIHEKRGRVKVDRFAAPGALGERLGDIGPVSGGIGGG